MRKLKLFLTLLMLMCIGVTQMWAADEVYKTATFSKTSFSANSQAYTGVSFNSTTNDFTVAITNANNNNKGWDYIKIGGKNGAYTGTITTSTAIDKAITKVELTIDAMSYSSNVTSIKLYSSSNNSSWTELGTFTKATGTQSVTISSPAASRYYKIEVVCTKAGGNGCIQLSEVKYYIAQVDPSYTITAQSNDNSKGTVSLSGSVITGSPKSGYRYASPAYSVSPANSATVAQDGNAFTVTPSANTTVTINFEAIPTHTVTWSKNGSTSSENYAEGAAISFPASASGCDGKTFVGWSASTINGETDNAPTFVTSATMGNSDVTYYAVFADVVPGDDSWELTALADLTSSDVFVMGSDACAIPNNGGTSAPTVAAITVANNKITSAVADNLKWNVSGNATNGYTFYPNGTTESWLYCSTTAASSSNNNIAIGTGARKVWELDNSGYLITKDTYTARYLSIYSNQDFRGYVNTSNGAFVFKCYKFVKGGSASGYATTCCTKYAVNIANNIANGTVSADVESACADATVTLSATPATGYQFSAWSVKKANDVVVEVTNNAFTMPSEAVTVSATFAAKHHDVVFHKNAGDNPEVTTKQDFAYGQTQNLTDNAWSRGEDYSFNGWNTLPTGLGTPYSDGASFTLNVDANVDLYAQWLENTSHAVSYSGDAHIASYSVKPIKIAEDAEELTAEFALETGYKVTAVAATINDVAVDANNIAFDNTMVYITSTGFAGDVVITFTIEEIIYTVTFDKGTGVCATASLPQASYNATIELPSATPSVACQDEEYGWSFAGWKVGEGVATETSDAQTLLAAGSNYQPESDVTLYAVYKRSEAGSGTTEKTASVTISEYATAHSWAGSGSPQVAEIPLNEDITATTNTSGNNGKYYTDWRFYQSDNGVLTLTASNGCTLKSATFTYSTKNNTDVLLDGENQIATDEEYEIEGTPTSKEFSVGNTGSATNGQVRFTVISVTYNKPADATIYYHSTPSCAQKYTITVDGEIANGSVAVSPNVAKATAGTALTLTATAIDNVSRFKQWAVTGMGLSNEQKATSPLNIEMPASNLTVSATFDALYAITPELVNGTFDLDKNYAIEGETVTISNISANAQYKDPVLEVYYVVNEVKTIVSLTQDGDNYTFKMPAHAVNAKVTCSPALVALAAPELTATPTYQGVSFTWTGVEGNEGYVLTIEGFDPVAIDKNATSYEKATGLTANTAYNYSIYTKGNGTTTLEVNTPAESSFTTSDYPAATLSLVENGGEAYAWGSNLKVNDVIALPEELDGLGCTGKVLVGWSSVAVSETDEEPTSNYWAKGADYTIASTADVLYAVLATEVSAGGYTKVTAVSQLEAGDKVVITNGTNRGMKAYESGNNCKEAEITIVNNAISSLGEACELTVGGSENAWTFFDGTYYIYAAGTATSGSNYMKGKATSDNACLWTITISNGETTIQSNNNDKTPYMRYNSSSKLFSCYNSSTGQAGVTLYRKGEASYSGYTTSCEAQLPKLDAPVFGGIEEGVYYEAQNNITLSAADGATIYYVIDEDEITAQNRAEYTVGAISLSDYGVHTVKAIAVKEGYEASDVATATYAIGKEFASVSDLYTYLEAQSLTSMNNVKVTGLVSRIKSIDPSKYVNGQYYISVNGQESNELYIYNGKYINGADFTTDPACPLNVGDQVTIIGNYAYTSNEHRLAQGNTIVARTAAAVASVAIGGAAEKTTYSPEDNAFDRTGLTATATYNTGYTKDVTALATWTNNLTNDIVTASGNVAVTATYEGQNDTKEVAVTYTTKTLDHITLSYTSTTAYVGMALPTPTVTASYVEDIEDEDVTALVAAANGFDTESAYDGTAAGSYTINVSYTLGEVTKSAEYTVTVIAVFGNEENPHAASAAKAMIEARPDNTESSTTEFMWVRGIVSQANNANNNKQSYYISDDGETTNQLYVYNGNYFQATSNFSTDNQLQVGDEVVIKARVQLYKNNQNVITPELKYSNVTSHFRMPAFAFDDIVAADEFEAGYSTGVTIVPTENTNDAAFTLVSSDEAIVKVVDGNKLSAIAAGDAVITATRVVTANENALNYKAKSVDFNVHVIAERTRYTVTFDAGEAGDNVSGDAPETIAAQLEGAPVELPECTYTWTHHGFTGWKVINLSTSAEIEVENNQFTMPGANVKIQAQWEEIATTHIVFNVNGNTETVVAVDVPQAVEYSITQVTDGQNGYEFVGWAENPETEDVEEAIATIESYTPEAGEASKTLYAVFKRVDEGAPKTDVLTADDLAATSTGYVEFSNVQKNSAAKYAGKTAKNGENIQINEKSKQGIYSSVSGGTLVSIRIQMTSNTKDIGVYGSNTGFTGYTSIPSQEGVVEIEKFANKSDWTVTPSSDYKYVGITSATDGAKQISSISITWQPKTTYYTTAPSAVYAVSYVLGEGGAWEGDACDGANVKAGKTFDICESVPVRENYKFVKWQVAGEDVSGTITINAETEITAVWEAKVKSNVTYNAGTGTGDNVEVANVEEGTIVTLPTASEKSMSKEGYNFVGWLYGDVLYKAGETFEMPAEAVTLTAQWKMQNVEKLTLVTDASQLLDGMEIVLACKNPVSNNQQRDPAIAGVMIDNKYLKSVTTDVTFNNDNTVSYTSEDVITFTLESASEGWALRNGTNYLTPNSNNNQVKWGTSPFVWSISIANGNAYIQQGNYTINYNASSGTERFSQYTNQQNDIQIYGKATVVNSNTNISDYGYVEGDVIVLSNNATLTVDADIAPTTMIVPKGSTVTVNDNQKIDANTLIVERGGTLDIQTNGTVKTDETFVIYSTLGKGNGGTSSGNAPGSSSQIKNANKINATGDVFFELELTQEETASEGWYAFSVPFPVDAINGVYYGNTQLQNEVGYAIMSYHGDKRAAGEYAWKKYRDIMVPGVLYIIAVGDTDYKTLRFKKHGDDAFSTSTGVAVKQYSSEIDGTYAGWNGIGNPSMQVSYLPETDNVYYMQFLDHANNRFKIRQRSKINLVVGSAFFIQYRAADGQIAINTGVQDGANGYLAPTRERSAVEESIYEISLINNNTEEVEDYLFVTAREEATNSYEIGRDVAKMSMGTAKCAQMSIPAYGTQLCAADFPLVNDQVTYPLNINTPKAGSYSLVAPNAENADIYLTHEDAIIWNLSESAYTIDLTKGVNTGYGLLLKAKMPQTPTGIENGGMLNGANGVQKVIIDENVFILRGGQMYDVTGKAVK